VYFVNEKGEGEGGEGGEGRRIPKLVKPGSMLAWDTKAVITSF
jgi:hypothetical protein